MKELHIEDMRVYRMITNKDMCNKYIKDLSKSKKIELTIYKLPFYCLRSQIRDLPRSLLALDFFSSCI